MAEMDKAWNDVANRLEALGKSLRDTAQGAGAQQKQGLENALRQLNSAMEKAVATVKQLGPAKQAGDVGRSLVEAVASTLDEASRTLRAMLT